MLRSRLLLGTLMTTVFAGLIVLDGFIDGSISPDMPDKKIQATLLTALMALMAVPAQSEMAGLARKVGAKIFKGITIPASVMLATSWYWSQFSGNPMRYQLYYILFVPTFSMFAFAIVQGRKYGGQNMIKNCAVNYFNIFYLGFLSCFILGIRIDYGLWELVMFIMVIKFSDIGAYTFGKNFGKRKFSPRISPNKTWEGVLGACVFGGIVAYVFAAVCGIMGVWAAIVFGLLFGYLGQLGDLIESMIKRDAGQKDSSDKIPGFGGLLDVIDSPVATAPLAYLYFVVIHRFLG